LVINIFAQQKNSTISKWQTSFYIGAKSGNLSGPVAGIKTIYNKSLGINIQYGKNYFSEFGAGVPILLLHSKKNLYIEPAYSFLHKGNSDSYEINIHTASLSIGYLTELTPHLFLDSKVQIQKYLSESYKSRQLHKTEKYDINEKIFFEISVSLGYHFGRNKL
jgi:hypothetical protein